MEEDEFLEVATRKQRLVQLVTPFVWRVQIEVSPKTDFHVSCSAPSAYARRSPCDGIRKGLQPLSNVGIVELVGGDQMPDSPEVLKLVCKLAIELRRRVKEKIAVRKAHHSHAGGERYRQPDAGHGQVFKGPV